jgi:hypothetical protein
VTTGCLKGTLGTQLGDFGGARGLHSSRQGPRKVPQRLLSSFLSDQRLSKLRLEHYNSITDRTQNDCLFLAAIDRIREYAYGERTRNKAFIAAGEGHVDSVLQDATGADVKWRITDVQGLRNFIALAAMQHGLRANVKRTQLLNHIKHRSAGGMCEADAALQHVAPLEQDPSEVQVVTKWAEIISNGGVSSSHTSCPWLTEWDAVHFSPLQFL